MEGGGGGGGGGDTEDEALLVGRDSVANNTRESAEPEVHVESEFDRNKISEITWNKPLSFERAALAAEHSQARWNTNEDFHFPHFLSIELEEFEELTASADETKRPKAYPIW